MGPSRPTEDEEKQFELSAADHMSSDREAVQAIMTYAATRGVSLSSGGGGMMISSAQAQEGGAGGSSVLMPGGIGAIGSMGFDTFIRRRGASAGGLEKTHNPFLDGSTNEPTLNTLLDDLTTYADTTFVMEILVKSGFWSEVAAPRFVIDGLKMEYNKLIWNEGVAEELPELSAPNMISFRRERFQAGIRRMGIGMQATGDSLRTPRGRLIFNKNIERCAVAVTEATDRDAIAAFLRAGRRVPLLDTRYPRGSGHTASEVDNITQRAIRSFNITRADHGLEYADIFLDEELESRNGRGNVLVVDGAKLRIIAMQAPRVETWRGGTPASMKTPISMIRNTGVFTPSFGNYGGRRRTPITVTVQTGEGFPLEGGKITEIYDHDLDMMVELDLENALTHVVFAGMDPANLDAFADGMGVVTALANLPRDSSGNISNATAAGGIVDNELTALLAKYDTAAHTYMEQYLKTVGVTGLADGMTDAAVIRKIKISDAQLRKLCEETVRSFLLSEEKDAFTIDPAVSGTRFKGLAGAFVSASVKAEIGWIAARPYMTFLSSAIMKMLGGGGTAVTATRPGAWEVGNDAVIQEVRMTFSYYARCVVIAPENLAILYDGCIYERVSGAGSRWINPAHPETNPAANRYLDSEGNAGSLMLLAYDKKQFGGRFPVEFRTRHRMDKTDSVADTRARRLAYEPLNMIMNRLDRDGYVENTYDPAAMDQIAPNATCFRGYHQMITRDAATKVETRGPKQNGSGPLPHGYPGYAGYVVGNPSKSIGALVNVGGGLL